MSDDDTHRIDLACAAPAWPEMGSPRIGVFDSGLGGLSILGAIRAHLPHAHLVYVADSGHAPYGEKTDDFIAQRSQLIATFLRQRGVDAVVVACNTATAAAVHHLRDLWPQMPVIGVEPGVKPAVQHSKRHCVGVLATPLTLASEKFAQLVQRHEGQSRIVLQACPGLAAEIEKGQLDSPALRTLVQGFTQPLMDAGVDTVALGCTHYPLITPLFQEALGPQVHIIDTSDAVARQVARQVAHQATTKSSEYIELWSSGDPAHLSLVAHQWLGLRAQARSLP